MTIRDMMAFDHIVPGLSATGGNLAAYSDTALVYAPNPGVGVPSQGGVFVDTDRVWYRNSASANGDANNYMGYLGAPFSAFSDPTASRSYFGFRWKSTGQSIQFTLAAIYNAAKVLVAPLVLTSDMTFVANKAYYIEVMIDRVNFTRTVWVDGNRIINAAALTNPAQINTATNAISYGFMGVVSGSFTNQYNYTDLYWVDDPLATLSRLGPIVANPITVAAASGNGWTPTSGTIAAALNTSVTGGSFTPNVVAPQDGTPLVSTLATSANPMAAVQGVLLLSSGSRQTGTQTQFQETLKDQATPTPNSKVLNPIIFPSDAPVYGRKLGFLPTALDNSPWTPAKIAQLQLSTVAA